LKNKALYSHLDLDWEMDFSKHQLVRYNLYLFDWTMLITDQDTSSMTVWYTVMKHMGFTSI